MRGRRTDGQRDRERQRGRETKKIERDKEMERQRQINRCSNDEMDKWKNKQTQKKRYILIEEWKEMWKDREGNR